VSTFPGIPQNPRGEGEIVLFDIPFHRMRSVIGISSIERFGIDSLKMKCTATPVFRSDIGDGFREVPAVSVKVLSIVLALAIGLVLGFSQDDGSVSPSAFAVTIGIFDTNLNDVRIVRRRVPFSDGDAALPGFHLDAVIGDAKPDGEAKSLCQPCGCRTGVRVNEHRNHRARRNRSVESHFQTLSLNTREEDECN